MTPAEPGEATAAPKTHSMVGRSLAAVVQQVSTRPARAWNAVREEALRESGVLGAGSRSSSGLIMLIVCNRTKCALLGRSSVKAKMSIVEQAGAFAGGSRSSSGLMMPVVCNRTDARF